MRRFKLIAILAVGCIVLFSVFLFSQANDYCSPSPPNDGDRGPGNDHGDDNFSISDAIVIEYNLAPEAVIYLNGYYQEALRLYGGLKFDGNNPAQELIKTTPFLVIPSGGLFGKENDSTFKEILKEYVKLGGTLVVYAQQQGYNFDKVLPLPEGERLQSVGWRGDQSCYQLSSYYEQMHPVLSSWVSWGTKGTMGTDGYFVDYPANSTVLLRPKTGIL